MFFIFSKILFFLTTPIVWIISVFIYSVFTKIESRRKKSFIAGIILLYFFSNSFVLNEIMQQWEIPAKPQETLAKYDIGIVLGGMSVYDDHLKRIQFQRGADRLFQTLGLYKKGIVKKIFISGGSGSLAYPEMKESIFIQEYLVNIGFPKGDIIIETESKNTYENAVFAKQKLEELGIGNGKILLITSGFHLRRAEACFRKAGIDFDSYSTDRISGERKFALDHLFVPTAESLFTWSALIKEWIGFLTYRIAGYV